MKKIIVAFAIAAMTAAGFSAAAQDNKQVCPNQANCPNAKECPQTACKPCVAPMCCFEGLNLTDAQKQKLQEVCTNHRADMRKSKADAKTQRREARRQARREHLAQIKQILTPEQYVQFLENNFVEKNGKFGKAGKRGRGFNGRCPQGQRPGCPNVPANCPNAPQSK